MCDVGVGVGVSYVDICISAGAARSTEDMEIYSG
jgi:hypothetical protein